MLKISSRHRDSIVSSLVDSRNVYQGTSCCLPEDVVVPQYSHVNLRATDPSQLSSNQLCDGRHWRRGEERWGGAWCLRLGAYVFCVTGIERHRLLHLQTSQHNYKYETSTNLASAHLPSTESAGRVGSQLMGLEPDLLLCTICFAPFQSISVWVWVSI